MKQLQNNFTTPEQSKWLVKLGLPANSADMHYHQECVRMKYGKEEFEYFLRYGKPDTNKYSTDIPCWSVGRLMEIFDICYSETNANEKWENHNALHKGQIYIDYIIYVFDHNYMLGKLDFSKLEE